jgi:hypothetical protein
MRTAEFISPEDPRWEKFLRTCRHDFYHLPDYVKLCAKSEGATPAAFYAEDGHAAFLAPLLIRAIPRNLGASEGWSDAASPYGYSAPLVTPSEVSLCRFLDAFCHAARLRGLVTAFFRLHPLLSLNHEDLSKFGQLINHGQTVFFDLAKSDEEVWKQISPDHRRNIRKMLSLGFTVSLDDWRLFKDFTVIYQTTMRRVGASEGYLFSEEYFADLRTALGERLHLCCVLSPKGDVAAAGLFIETERIVQHHLGGTASEYAQCAPTKLLYPFMSSWARARSNTVLHIGGGLGGADDPLFRYKAWFSRDRAEFFTYRMILDEKRNDMLIRLANARNEGTGSSSSSFFPAYRAG